MAQTQTLMILSKTEFVSRTNIWVGPKVYQRTRNAAMCFASIGLHTVQQNATWAEREWREWEGKRKRGAGREGKGELEQDRQLAKASPGYPATNYLILSQTTRGLIIRLARRYSQPHNLHTAADLNPQTDPSAHLSSGSYVGLNCGQLN